MYNKIKNNFLLIDYLEIWKRKQNLYKYIVIIVFFLFFLKSFVLEAHRALELLEDYHAKLTRPQDKQLRLAIERVIRIFKSRLFQALLGKFFLFWKIYQQISIHRSNYETWLYRILRNRYDTTVSCSNFFFFFLFDLSFNSLHSIEVIDRNKAWMKKKKKSFIFFSNLCDREEIILIGERFYWGTRTDFSIGVVYCLLFQ